MSSIIKEWQTRIENARASQQPLQIRGNGSKAFYGQQPIGEVLDTRVHNGIVSYEPTELVITAKAGTPLAELEAALAEKNQMLAFEPPHFGNATLGGCIAAGLAGPRRLRAGTVRDFILGAQLLDGNGKLMDFGGQVMKNVAGYDVSRFLAGSLGILGIITQASLKVLPIPECEHTLLLELDQAQALQDMCNWASKPLPISATAWHQDQLHIRLSGASSAVTTASKLLGGELLNADAAAIFWQSLREQQHAFFNDDSPLWRVALPATTADLNTPASDTLLEWNGTQRWLQGNIDGPTLREQVNQLGGHATLFKGGDKTQGVFTPLPQPLLMLHQNLKSEFDPDKLFNPSRLYPSL